MISCQTRGVVKADAGVWCEEVQAGLSRWGWLVEVVRDELATLSADST